MCVYVCVWGWDVCVLCCVGVVCGWVCFVLCGCGYFVRVNGWVGVPVRVWGVVVG